MRPVFALLLLLLTAVGVPMSAVAEDLALKRVLLSTGGVGYFEYEAKVDGNAELSLNVRLDQVDDVLKSIVVYDDKGQTGSISLPGKTPLKEIFREVPFSRKALDSPVALLSALRGAEVEIQGARKLKGRIISVRPEKTAIPNSDAVITRHRLSLMTAQGVRQLILEDTDLLKFADAKLQKDVDRVLAAIAEVGERDRRSIRVSLSGEGERMVRVAYVVEAPLWKTSYRLTMPSDPLASNADIQGWAVVENLSGEDWKNVELTIVSGNPVTFRQALYDAYYVDRAEVPIEVLGRIIPRADEGAVPSAKVTADARRRPRPKRKAARGRVAAVQAPSGGLMSMMSTRAAEAPRRPERSQVVASASTEATSYVIFQHPKPVNVANGHSLAIPIVARELKAERVAFYQRETHATHPLAAIGLKNESGTALPPGIITLYERGGAAGIAYVGDATMKTLPNGEKRLLSYALDQKTRIDREDRSRNDRVATSKIAGGHLVLRVKQRQETVYRIKTPANEARRVVIEHRRLAGWDLAEPKGGEIELTANHYRITKKVKAGEVATLRVLLERTVTQRHLLTSLTRQQIRLYVDSKDLTEAQRKAIATLSEKLKTIEDAETEVAESEQIIQELIDNQSRLRENLGSVPKDSDLFQRYLGQMQSDENAIDEGRKALAAGREAVSKARQDLLTYARSLEL